MVLLRRVGRGVRSVALKTGATWHGLQCSDLVTEPLDAADPKRKGFGLQILAFNVRFGVRCFYDNVWFRKNGKVMYFY